MNSNLLLLLDQATFAPAEVKSDILSTLISEGSFTRKMGTATFFGELTVKTSRLLLGKVRVKRIFKEYFLKNPQTTENDFVLLLSTLITKEPLSLVQDFLYALYLTKWEFEKDDMKKYFDGIINNTSSHPYDQLPTDE
jgi:hypothetical protein